MDAQKILGAQGVLLEARGRSFYSSGRIINYTRAISTVKSFTVLFCT